MDNIEKPSRRDALKRMAKASVGVGIGLQLIGVFVPAAQAAPTEQGARFSTIGHVSSSANIMQPDSREVGVRSCGVYTNGGSYSQNGYTQYGKYADYVNDGNCK